MGRMWPRAAIVDSGPGMIHLLLVDHPPAVRRTLRAYLSLEPEVAVVGEADDVPTALGLAQALQPDVVLLDAEMPDVDVRETVGLLRARSPASTVVILSLNPAALARTLGAGTVVLVGKHEGAAGLLAAALGGRR